MTHACLRIFAVLLMLLCFTAHAALLPIHADFDKPIDIKIQSTVVPFCGTALMQAARFNPFPFPCVDISVTQFPNGTIITETQDIPPFSLNVCQAGSLPMQEGGYMNRTQYLGAGDVWIAASVGAWISVEK